MNFNQMVNKILMVVHDLIRREVPKLAPPLRWATVQTTNPLRIKFDGPGGDLDAKPDETVGLMVPGDRVTVHHKNGDTPIITGVSGGAGTGIRSFPTLAAATAANLPPGVMVLVSSENQHYMRLASGFEKVTPWKPFMQAPILTGAYGTAEAMRALPEGNYTSKGGTTGLPTTWGILEVRAWSTTEGCASLYSMANTDVYYTRWIWNTTGALTWSKLT